MLASYCYTLPSSSRVVHEKPLYILSLICHGPKSPKKNIAIFSQPLIEELKHLWEVGVETYDISTYKNFNIRAALMWTINDFLAYGMLSGWSTSRLLRCPICIKKSKAFY